MLNAPSRRIARPHAPVVLVSRLLRSFMSSLMVHPDAYHVCYRRCLALFLPMFEATCCILQQVVLHLPPSLFQSVKLSVVPCHLLKPHYVLLWQIRSPRLSELALRSLSPRTSGFTGRWHCGKSREVVQGMRASGNMVERIRIIKHIRTARRDLVQKHQRLRRRVRTRSISQPQPCSLSLLSPLFTYLLFPSRVPASFLGWLVSAVTVVQYKDSLPLTQVA